MQNDNKMCELIRRKIQFHYHQKMGIFHRCEMELSSVGAASPAHILFQNGAES